MAAITTILKLSHSVTTVLRLSHAVTCVIPPYTDTGSGTSYFMLIDDTHFLLIDDTHKLIIQ